jgi:hypothetical protein
MQPTRSWRLFKIKPSEFGHSENVFRIFTMEHVLRSQFGVRYDPLQADATPDEGAKTCTCNSQASLSTVCLARAGRAHVHRSPRSPLLLAGVWAIH